MNGSGRLLVLFATVALPLSAAASQPAPTCRAERPLVELMPWLSIGAGHRVGDDGRETYMTVALDGAATFPVAAEVLRIGPWGQVGTGGFLMLQGAGGVRFDLTLDSDVSAFYTTGAWALALDAGVGATLGSGLEDGDGLVATARLGFGFRTPLRLYDLHPESCDCPPMTFLSYSDWTCRPKAGVLSGFRVFAGASRTVMDSPVWEITFGLEVEPIGLSWLILGAN